MVFGMEVSFELSVPCFNEIQVSLKMRVFPVELCPKKFCHVSRSTVEAICHLSWIKVDAQSVINWTVVGQLS